MEIGERIAREALNWIGVPYQHRAMTKNGCDCTGLILGVLKTLGYLGNYKVREYPIDWNLHGMADDHIRDELLKVTNEISGSEKLLKGDILLFWFGRCVSHIGIYIGDRQFVHSWRNAKKCKIAPLMNKNGWASRFDSAYRFDSKKLGLDI